MDIKFCSITLKTKEKEISGLNLSFPIEKLKLGKNSYIVFRVKIERPEAELEMAEIFKVQLVGEIVYKNEHRTISVLGEKIL